MKPYHDPAEQIETEDIPPKESYKGPITRSRIKTLEQNDSGALSSFSREQCHTHNLLQVPIAELAERWTELPQVSGLSQVPGLQRSLQDPGRPTEHHPSPKLIIYSSI
ncbi:hypothetical protein TNCV_3453741 [Trichonephila clavipes]|nr:hypothetical protein TNCV_3453741 [Trichonephila clavipes]